MLITGETGTGKELMAHLIAELGQKPDRPFIAVNCAAIPATLWEDEIFGHIKGAFTDARADRPGRVAEAMDGILFFDEIGEMPLDMQGKCCACSRRTSTRRWAARHPARPAAASSSRPTATWPS